MLDQFYDLLKALAVIMAFPLALFVVAPILGPVVWNILRGWRMVWTRRK